MKKQNMMGEPFSEHDLITLSKEIADGHTIKSENFYADFYLDEVIDKPWGLEYRVYADMLVDVWRLSIKPAASTSMHCHPRKNTVLICLGGSVRVNFIRASHLLTAGDFISIPKGVFHSTDNIGSDMVELIEVETPRNKFDLVRAQDKYGRGGQSYETDKSAKVIAPMMACSSSSGAKIRSSDLSRDFHFTIATGNEIGKNTPENSRFAISLSLEDAIEQNINVFSLANYVPGLLKNHNPYLVVSFKTF